MKIKKNLFTQIWKTSAVYIFAVLFFQLSELVVGFSVTKVFLLFFMFCILNGILKRKIKVSSATWAVIVYELLYCCYYISFDADNFNNFYPLAITLCIAALLLDNADSASQNVNIKHLNRLILLYALINILLLLSGFNAAFQNSGAQMQFKGALPHSNLFCGVSISLFVLVFWDKGVESIISKILLTVLIFSSLSRTYTLLVIALWLIWLLSYFAPQLKTWFKLVVGSVIVALCGVPLFLSMVSRFSVLARFRSGIFSNMNGRNYLQSFYLQAMNNSGLLEKISGIHLASKYREAITIDFPHSFTENSYMGTIILTGFLGIALLAFLLSKLIKCCSNIQSIGVIAVLFSSLFFQDTLITTQNGILLFFSLIVMTKTVPDSLRKDNFRRIRGVHRCHHKLIFSASTQIRN